MALVIPRRDGAKVEVYKFPRTWSDRPKGMLEYVEGELDIVCRGRLLTEELSHFEYLFDLEDIKGKSLLSIVDGASFLSLDSTREIVVAQFQEMYKSEFKKLYDSIEEANNVLKCTFDIWGYKNITTENN